MFHVVTAIAQVITITRGETTILVDDITQAVIIIQVGTTTPLAAIFLNRPGSEMRGGKPKSSSVKAASASTKTIMLEEAIISMTTTSLDMIRRMGIMVSLLNCSPR